MSHANGTASRTNNVLTWTFENIELPPNITPPQGEGWVQFTVTPKANLPTGTRISNHAVIVFDLNAPLATNATLNTLDFEPPKTTAPSVTKVPGKDQVALSWSVDDGKGAGVKKSMVFMASNDGPFTLVKTTDSLQASLPVVSGIPYRFYVLSEDNAGNAEAAAAKIISITTGVAADGTVPRAFALSQNYPNPFNPSTTMTYDLPHAARVSIEVTDILGRLVCTLVSAEQPAGRYTARWDGTNAYGAHAASGVYFCRMRSDGSTITKKMMLLK
jgi:hypothetical protein